MTSKSLKSFYLAAAACFAAFSAPVQGGNWGGDYDPTGGTVVTGFNGTDLINVSGSDCLPGTTAGGFFYVNGFGGNNCTSTLLNATITLHSDGPDTAQISFGPSTAIWGLDIGTDGTLLGVDSFQIGPAFPGGSFNPIFAGPWFITLTAHDGMSPPCFECFLVAAAPPATSNTVILNDGVRFESHPYVFFPVATPMPEPGSIALLLGALGAGWLTRKRKARA